jgi:hypothetical protein
LPAQATSKSTASAAAVQGLSGFSIGSFDPEVPDAEHSRAVSALALSIQFQSSFGCYLRESPLKILASE